MDISSLNDQYLAKEPLYQGSWNFKFLRIPFKEIIKFALNDQYDRAFTQEPHIVMKFTILVDPFSIYQYMSSDCLIYDQE